MLSIFSKRFTYRVVFLSIMLGLLGSGLHAQQNSTDDFPSELPSADSVGTRGLSDLTSPANAFQFKKPVYLLKRRIVRPKRVPPSGPRRGLIAGSSIDVGGATAQPDKIMALPVADQVTTQSGGEADIQA